MWDYFKPLRRKIGIVTLLLACVFAGGWMRSRTQADWILLFGRITLVSGGQKIVAADRDQIGVVRLYLSKRRIETVAKFPDELWFGWDTCTSGGILTGFDSGIRMLPYWSVVVPLTLASAYLLLGMPRTNKAKPVSKS